EVAALLARYQAGLDDAAAVDPRDDGFEATRGAAEPGRSPTAPSPADGYATQAPSRAIGRRRALTGLGGLAAAGLATAGWAVSRSGGGKRPEAHGQPTGRLLW